MNKTSLKNKGHFAVVTSTKLTSMEELQECSDRRYHPHGHQIVDPTNFNKDDIYSFRIDSYVQKDLVDYCEAWNHRVEKLRESLGRDPEPNEDQVIALDVNDTI